MALFQRRPQTSDPVQYYSVGLNKTMLLVGLGNPGKEYEQTRHNVGFACIDAFVAKNGDMSTWLEKKDLKCLFSSGQLGHTRVIAIKPTTFMNLSGEAVEAVMNFYKLPLSSVAVVYDELAIDFGQIRTRVGGESAGHNGVKSIIASIGEEFGRIRVGIGPKQPEQMETQAFVLAKFSSQEQEQFPNLTREVNAILSEFVFGDQLPHETRSFLV